MKASARTNMPIWPWNALIRPNGPAAFGVLDEIERFAVAHDMRERREGREAIGEDHRARAGTAAAVRRREGLVQVDVHGVDAEIAGPGLADDGVEIRAVAVEIGAGRVHGVGDRDDVALEQAAGVGIGEHDRGDVRAERRAHALRAHHAVGAGGHGAHRKADQRRRGGIGAVRGIRHEHDMARLLFAARRDRGLDRHHAAQFAMGARFRRHRDRAHAGQRQELARERVDQFERALDRRDRLQRMNVGKSPAGAPFSR